MDYLKKNREPEPFNGHPSWQFWNVFLWISDDYDLYHEAVDLIDRYGNAAASEILFRELQGHRTPDGALFSRAAIRNAIKCLPK